MTIQTLLIVWAASTVLGGLIGASKGRGGEGVALGLLLGLVGVVIALALKPAEPTSPPPSASAWWPDPHGRHQYRYWDGTSWTEHVADAGVASVDA